MYIFLAPAASFSYEARCADLRGMREYFVQHNMPYVDYELEKGKEVVSVSSIVDPDIMFYAQPYEKAVETQYDFMYFQDKLLCHIPYSFLTRSKDFYENNLRFNNIAWKLYYQTDEGKSLAKDYSYNHGQNVVVVGYPNADDYRLPIKSDPWKVKDRSIKRIVWAPHFTIKHWDRFLFFKNNTIASCHISDPKAV